MVAKPVKKDGRGGARPNSGPKKECLSVRQLKQIQKVAEDLAKEFRMPVIEVVGRMAYDEEAPRRDRLAAAKLFLDKSLISASEGGEADKNTGPAVYLPEHRNKVLKLIQKADVTGDPEGE